MDLKQGPLRDYILDLLKNEQKLSPEINAILDNEYLKTTDVGKEQIAREIYYEIIKKSKDPKTFQTLDEKVPTTKLASKLRESFSKNYNDITGKIMSDLETKYKIDFGFLGNGFDDKEFQNAVNETIHDQNSEVREALVKGGDMTPLVNSIVDSIVYPKDDTLFKNSKYFQDLRNQIPEDNDVPHPMDTDAEFANNGIIGLIQNIPGVEYLTSTFNSLVPKESTQQLLGHEDLKLLANNLTKEQQDNVNSSKTVKSAASKLYEYFTGNSTQDEGSNQSDQSGQPNNNNEEIKAQLNNSKIGEEEEQSFEDLSAKQAMHNRVIDRLALRSSYGIQGSDDLKESEEELKRQDEVWKTFQNIQPGFGQIKKGKRNVLVEQNNQNERIQYKKPMLNVGSQDQLPGNSMSIEDLPLKQQAYDKRSILIDLLAERLVEKNKEIMLSIRGGDTGRGIQHDIADDDYSGLNRKRPRNDVLVPKFDTKKMRTMLPVYDNGATTTMTSVFDRQPDHIKRFTHR
jgi:hypothetical protein